jgi:predicted TIM-barrel fold metal-dependent hydrolase
MTIIHEEQYLGDSSLAREFWGNGKSSICPIYDMHGHMGAFAQIYFPRADPEAMIGTMDDCGVKMLVFSHHLGLLTPDHGNQPTIDAVRRYPDRLKAYMVIHPNYPELFPDYLTVFEANPDVFVGFKFLPDYHEVALTSPNYQPAWEYADQHSLMVLTHTWGKSPYDGADVVRQVAERYPRVRLLLGHSCHGDWQAAISLARDFPNIYLELTAVFDDRGVLEMLVQGAGSNRMLFGTDLPWFDPHHAVGALLSARISDDDRHNICHRNAEQLLATVLSPG